MDHLLYLLDVIEQLIREFENRIRGEATTEALIDFGLIINLLTDIDKVSCGIASTGEPATDHVKVNINSLSEMQVIRRTCIPVEGRSSSVDQGHKWDTLSIPDSLPELEEVSEEELIRQVQSQGVLEPTGWPRQSDIWPNRLDLATEYEYLGVQVDTERSIPWTSMLAQLVRESQ